MRIINHSDFGRISGGEKEEVGGTLTYTDGGSGISASAGVTGNGGGGVAGGAQVTVPIGPGSSSTQGGWSGQVGGTNTSSSSTPYEPAAPQNPASGVPGPYAPKN